MSPLERACVSLPLAALTFFLFPLASRAQTPPEALTRPAGCVLDDAAALDASTVDAIEVECENVAAQGHELAVVVVSESGAGGSAQYALDLYNAWRLGGPNDSDGVLIFAAIDERKAEIVLGEDLDTPANTERSDRVMMEAILPGFREGSADRAMFDGARYAAANLFTAGEAPFVHPEERGVPPRAAETPSPPRQSTADSPYEEPYEYDEPGPFAFLSEGHAPMIGLGFLGVFFLFGLRLFMRHRRRDCDRCGSPMIRLGEAEDDAHLSPAERKEEEIGSVDYDVWACSSCDNLVEKRYAAFFSRYRKCRSCGARTESSVSRTIEPATEHSTGLAEVRTSCKHCRVSSTRTHTIPRRRPPSSRGGGSSTGSRSYGGSGRSGGGGRSRGGGSSGSW